MNIAEALAVRGEPDSYERQEGAWLLEHLLDLTSLALKMQSNQVLTETQEQDYLAGLQRIDAGEPLAYVIGHQPFWTLNLKVTPDTLVPRPDTEILVETVLGLPLDRNADVVDLGTGTGAIALSLAIERPQWQVLATDIYPATLAVAQHNAREHGLSQVKFACGAWYAALAPDHKDQRFDLIVSNPPYIDAEDVHMQALSAEPERALVAAQQGLADLVAIVTGAAAYLKAQGWLVLEHGYQQAEAVQQLLSQAGFSHVRSVQDYGGNDRLTLGQWIS